LGGEGGTLYFMVLTTPANDHGGGLTEVLDRYEVKNYYETALWTTCVKDWYSELWSALTGESGLEYYYFVSSGEHAFNKKLSPPSQAEIGPGWDEDIDARLITAWNCLSYSSSTDYSNRRSSIIRVGCGKSSFLCGGDATGFQSETSGADGTQTPNVNYYPEYYARAYCSSDIAVDIFAVNCNGSDAYGSNGIYFINRVSPRYGIVQTGYSNSGSREYRRYLVRRLPRGLQRRMDGCRDRRQPARRGHRDLQEDRLHRRRRPHLHRQRAHRGL
ncbi:MAG: hypothetical protein NTV79_00420, partial [Candidatus Aureabacteria bacterium]|nr:hypothetical protein [Candidatus Auribacterota bacterium]